MQVVLGVGDIDTKLGSHEGTRRGTSLGRVVDGPCNFVAPDV